MSLYAIKYIEINLTRYGSMLTHHLLRIRKINHQIKLIKQSTIKNYVKICFSTR